MVCALSLSVALRMVRSGVSLVRAHGDAECSDEVAFKVGTLVRVDGIWGVEDTHPISGTNKLKKNIK